MKMSEFVVKDSGKRQEYASGMVRDTQEDKPNYNLIDKDFLLRLANHLTKGAIKYGRDNWRNANSEEEMQRFQDSAFRHMMQWMNGETDEDHMSACSFNMMAFEFVKNKLKVPVSKIVEQSVKVQVPFKVKITKAIKMAWWEDRVGEVFTAKKSGLHEDVYVILGEDKIKEYSYIRIDCCEVL
jgi:hypothetical protein